MQEEGTRNMKGKDKDLEDMKDLLLKIKELEYQIDNVEGKHSNHLDENDVRALVDKILTEKEYVTQKEVDRKTTESHLQLIKWIIGTGLSATAIIVTIVGFL